MNYYKKTHRTSETIGLKINDHKTKYMLLSRHPVLQNCIIDQYSFEQIENFKYLGGNINNKSMHNEIKLRISAAN